jgi:hypothetical protein
VENRVAGRLVRCFMPFPMRAGSSIVFALVSGWLMACNGEAPQGPDDSNPALLLTGDLPPANASNDATPEPGKAAPAQPTTAATAAPPAPALDASTLTHPEVVYVLMEGKDGWTWFCTGALVSPKIVVTAAHCLQSALFLSWEVVAPTVANRPRVKVTRTVMFDKSWNDVGHPDIGLVELASPITLPRYAELTDVTAQVSSGDLSAATIVRKAEQPEAPLMKTGTLKLSSTTSFGYDHGYGVPLYSHGGDSGAGMFLIENGQMTHKLVAVEREPDPARKLDHLTRIDAAFRTWVTENSP